ncbi:MULTISPECIES: DUF5710 domain-containing protein [Achromobacter]|uniref:DUF5710 domain-containing protein n=1 Tax=Achromobacter TaxID=222 RepID=UPI0035570CE8
MRSTTPPRTASCPYSTICYQQKDRVKSLAALWGAAQFRWYVSLCVDASQSSTWLPRQSLAGRLCCSSG